MSGGTVPANMVKLEDGLPVVRHRENRPGSVLKSVEEAETLLRSGLHAWVPSADYLALRDRMAPEGAVPSVPPRSYRQLDDSLEAEGPPVYDNRTCAERHDDEFKALKMEVELLGRRVVQLERVIASWQAED